MSDGKRSTKRLPMTGEARKGVEVEMERDRGAATPIPLKAGQVRSDINAMLEPGGP